MVEYIRCLAKIGSETTDFIVLPKDVPGEVAICGTRCYKPNWRSTSGAWHGNFLGVEIKEPPWERKVWVYAKNGDQMSSFKFLSTYKQNYIQISQLDDTKTAGCGASQASLSLKDARDNMQKHIHPTASAKPKLRSTRCHTHVPITQDTPWLLCFQFCMVFSFKSAY